MAKGDTVLIPSGIKVQVPEGHALIAMNKSGVATKLGLQVGACVVDEDYEGEVHIHLTKLNHGTTKLEPGMKIVQFLLMPVNYANVEEVAELESRNTERGTGGFGSTGTH
jgi:dUTP pyrophosphatase